MLATMGGHWVEWVIAGAILIVLVLICCCRSFGPVHRGAGGETPPPLGIEIKEVMASIPAIPYQRQKCAICGAHYEDGDTCSVLPGCAHTFHKRCLARWLRKGLTCPICKQAMAVQGAPHGHKGNQLNAAENMV